MTGPSSATIATPCDTANVGCTTLLLLHPEARLLASSKTCRIESHPTPNQVLPALEVEVARYNTLAHGILPPHLTKWVLQTTVMQTFRAMAYINSKHLRSNLLLAHHLLVQCKIITVK